MEHNTFTDYFFAAGIVAEAFLLLLCLTSGFSPVGYVLPIAVSCVAFTISFLAIRDFFRQHK